MTPAQFAFARAADLPTNFPCDPDPDDRPCRFSALPGHVHTRSDGRQADEYGCHAEHAVQISEARAQVAEQGAALRDAQDAADSGRRTA